MVCDDSAVIRGAITRILKADPNIEVVAGVANGQAALDAVRRHDIDVIVLDIEMPVMDGLTALPLLLAASPGVAIIMASTLTLRGAEISMRALRLGAADTMPKPSALTLARDERFGPELIAKVLGLARIRRARARAPSGASESPHAAAPAGAPPQAAPITLRPVPSHTPRLLAIGSSTGGPNALFAVISALRRDCPVPVIITQHMPPTFTPILAQHIDRLGVLPCAEASTGDMLRPGHILLAPGNRHMLIHRRGSQLYVELSDGPAEQFCRPSVDPMLRSACEATDGRILIAMLTGMGQDGLLGTRQVVEAGGCAVVQDEASSVVWGMPGAVARAGLACAVLPLTQMGAKLTSLLAPRQAGRSGALPGAIGGTIGGTIPGTMSAPSPGTQASRGSAS